MPAQILKGTLLAQRIRERLKKQIVSYTDTGKRPPGLAVILVGHNPASELYVRNKQTACQEVGIASYLYTLDASTSEHALIQQIQELNEAPHLDGILLQLPLPNPLSAQACIEHLSPHKDVDGFHPYNLGRLAQRSPLLRPCTPLGILALLEATSIPLKGLEATIVGTSPIVGLPLCLELLMAGCTITACHKQTRDLAKAIQQSDLVIAAAGSPNLIQGRWIKEGSIVIDVGINRMDNGTLVGDVEFEEARQRAAYLTPVPGGVGPMTIAALLSNTVRAYETHYLKINPTETLGVVTR